MNGGSGKKYPVKPMYVDINMEETGKNIEHLIKESGYSMRDIMVITGVTTEQTIYKWYRGKSLPSLETQIILCRLFGLKATELLVVDEEFDFYKDDKEFLPYGESGREDRRKRLTAYWKAITSSGYAA